MGPTERVSGCEWPIGRGRVGDLYVVSELVIHLAGVVKGWVTYREVIRDTVRVRPKHGERSGGDCRVSKQDFRALEKLTNRPLERDGAHMPRVRVGALQGQLGPHGADCYRHLISSSPNLLCKSVDSPYLLGVTVAFLSHYTVSNIDGSSQSWLYDPPIPFLVAVTMVQECGYAIFSRYYINHRRLFTKSADPPIIFLVARTTMQECGLAKFDYYYVIAAIPSHYAVSSIDGSSKSLFYDPLTEPAISYGDSQTSRLRNPFV
ncbi:hypothetical protein YC2023_008343 [Brassica napus]